VIGELIASRYLLEELCGSGGMSSVYRAHDRLLERDVAIKILHSSYLEDGDAVERFRREARSVAQLSHPNVVTVIDRGEEDRHQFIVFEYVPGNTLKDYVARRGPLPPGEALSIAIEVGKGLAYAHRQGIVHRDVKPQNVILNGDGLPKVTDFGIARSVDVEKGVTQTGTVLGTSDYIAPEQASGGPAVPESDVYGLGCVLFELLTGSTPYSGGSFVDVAMKHIHSPTPSVREGRPEVPPRLAAAVERAMAKDPADRFGSMGEFVGELEACRAGLDRPVDETTAVVPESPAAVPPARRVPRPARRPPRRVGATVLPILLGLLVAGAVAAALLLARDGGSPLDVAAESSAPVKLRAAVSYDPQGDDGAEHPEDVPNATDGNRTTYWPTSTYRYPDGGLGKDGVGIVLDAGKSVKPSELVVVSDTPGFTAEIRTGGAAEGPFDDVAAEAKTVEGRTTFELDAESRYWLIWITNLGPNSAVRVNEVRAR
jgi:eukaryotic-like serine/threonine-protein kinase